jgi:hypothetical protein
MIFNQLRFINEIIVSKLKRVVSLMFSPAKNLKKECHNFIIEINVCYIKLEL